MHTSKITIKSLFGISEQEIGGKSVEITGRNFIKNQDIKEKKECQ